MTKTYRHNEYINRRTTQTIFKAFDFAEEIGRPLNSYAVINLPTAEEGLAHEMFTAIRHKYRDWLNNLSKKCNCRFIPTYVFAFENPDGHTHVNWVVHVPQEHAKNFAETLPKWITKVKGDLHSFDLNLQAVDHKAKVLAKYILKGTDPEFMEHFYLQEMYAPQGWFIGKRAGASPSLDKAARAAFGFHSRKTSRRWPNTAQVMTA